MEKKAQLQMGETIAILIIFFIFVAVGLVFYTKMMESGIDVKREENIQLEAVKVAQRASFLPELQCSEENIRKDNCVDLLKLDVAGRLIKDNMLNIYYDTFGLSRITIKEVFPGDKEWILYNATPEKWLDKKSTFIPIALSNYTARNYYFGVMEVEVYVK